MYGVRQILIEIVSDESFDQALRHIHRLSWYERDKKGVIPEPNSTTIGMYKKFRPKNRDQVGRLLGRQEKQELISNRPVWMNDISKLPKSPPKA